MIQKWKKNQDMYSKMDANFQQRDIISTMRKLMDKKYKIHYESRRENWQMFFQWHITLKDIEKMDKDDKGTCWKCKETDGTFYHKWWTWKKTSKF